jgi:3-oxoacyl-[acyl-carrier-protein] synthase II
MKRRVFVTGLGAVSPIGIGKENFWKNLISGECGVDYVTRFDASSYPCKLAAEVKDFQAPDIIGPKAARRLSRGTQFVIVSTQKALEDAQIDLHKEDPYQIGLCVSISFGPADIQSEVALERK